MWLPVRRPPDPPSLLRHCPPLLLLLHATRRCVQYAVTHWGNDPFSYGSYSYSALPVSGYDGYTSAHRE